MPSRQQRNEGLARLVARHVRRDGPFPTRRALALAIGMGESAFSQAMAGDIAVTPERAIRLAMVLRTSVPGVLRLAGHTDWARLFETHYPPAGIQLSVEEREVVRLWRKADLTGRDLAATLLLLTADGSGAAPIRTSGSVRRRARRLARDARAVARARQREMKGRRTRK